MAVIHPTAIRNNLADLVADAVDGGSSNGVLQFQTSGDAAVATVKFGDPAFGSAVGGTCTANAMTADSNAAGGTISKARAYTTNNGTTPVTECFACSVTATGGGGDVELNSVVVSAGQQVSVSSFTYSAAA